MCVCVGRLKRRKTSICRGAVGIDEVTAQRSKTLHLCCDMKVRRHFHVPAFEIPGLNCCLLVVLMKAVGSQS